MRFMSKEREKERAVHVCVIPTCYSWQLAGTPLVPYAIPRASRQRRSLASCCIMQPRRNGHIACTRARYNANVEQLIVTLVRAARTRYNERTKYLNESRARTNMLRSAVRASQRTVHPLSRLHRSPCLCRTH